MSKNLPLEQIKEVNDKFHELFADKNVTITINAEYLHIIALSLLWNSVKGHPLAEKVKTDFFIGNLLINFLEKALPESIFLYKRLKELLEKPQ